MKLILKIKISTLIFSIICFGDGMALAANKETQSKKIENVLDKLEQRLIDKESSPFTTEEEENTEEKQVKNNKTPTQTYSSKKPSTIKGQTPNGKNLQELQKKLNEYDNRIESLESDLRKIQANVYEGSTVDNQVSIEVKAANSSKFIIRTVTAKLDGNVLYNQLDPAGLWVPARVVPIYFGPLQPGEHRIDLTATIAPLSEDGLELATWKQKSLQQSFTFKVEEGKQRRTVALEIDTPKGADSRPIAKLLEAETK